MKALIFSALMMTSALSFAEPIDLATVKSLMTQRQAMLENVTPGMTKKVVTLSSFITDLGEQCNYKLTSTQTILKVEATRLLVYSQDVFSPANAPACRNAGVRPEVDKLLFYDVLPKVADDIAALEASQILSIDRNLDVVTVIMNVREQQEDGTEVSDIVSFGYDLSKPTFKNLVLTSGQGYTISTADATDVSPSSIDLSDVLFCENNDGDEAECVPGNYSDILF